MGEEYLPFKIFSVALLTHMSNQCVIKDYYQITIYKKKSFSDILSYLVQLIGINTIQEIDMLEK